MQLCFVDIQNEIILQKKITSLPLKDDVIIDKSIELFNDPEPCMIHRSAVMKNIYDKLTEYFDQKVSQGYTEVLWHDIPEIIKYPLDLKETVYRVIIKKTVRCL